MGALTFILAAILTFLNVKNFKMHAKELEGAEIPECDYKRVISSVILVLVYVMVSAASIGFILSTLVFLLLQMLVLSPDDERDAKHIIRLVVIDVIFTLVVFFLFRYGFKDRCCLAGIFTITL
ncbi:MAG: tripartite tricarboxylate transporter TctB family protein [Clostridium sp.]